MSKTKATEQSKAKGGEKPTKATTPMQGKTGANTSGNTTSEGRLYKKTKTLCKTCKYHTTLSRGHGDVVCYYIVIAQKSREIIPGYCNVYEKGKRECR